MFNNQKRCICVKAWNGYKIDDTTTITRGNKLWFLGGVIITPDDFKKHFKEV